jgi:hypothetical protein
MSERGCSFFPSTRLTLKRTRFFLLAVLYISSAYAQAVSATLIGTVTDSSGGVVPNAKITIVEMNTGVAQTRETNSSGNYTFPFVPPGRYRVMAELTGFKKEERAGVDLRLERKLV